MLHHVAHRKKHAVAVVVRERQGDRIDNANETGFASFVRAARLTGLVGRGEKEHVERLDECLVGISDTVDDQSLLDAVSKPASVEAVLQLAAALMIETSYMSFTLIHAQCRRSDEPRLKHRGLKQATFSVAGEYCRPNAPVRDSARPQECRDLRPRAPDRFEPERTKAVDRRWH